MNIYETIYSKIYTKPLEKNFSSRGSRKSDQKHPNKQYLTAHQIYRDAGFTLKNGDLLTLYQYVIKLTGFFKTQL